MELTAFRLENAPKSSKILCFSSKFSNFIALPPKNCIYNTKNEGHRICGAPRWECYLEKNQRFLMASTGFLRAMRHTGRKLASAATATLISSIRAN